MFAFLFVNEIFCHFQSAKTIFNNSSVEKMYDINSPYNQISEFATFGTEVRLVGSQRIFSIMKT